MRYIPHTEEDVRHMLAAIGAPSVESLFEVIPEKARLARPLNLRPAASEQEVMLEQRALSARNACLDTHDWFLGAGTYAHFVPSAVEALSARAEFLTAHRIAIFNRQLHGVAKRV